MTDIEQKALALVNAVEVDRVLFQRTQSIERAYAWDEALCRAIEQHEAFRQEVSDRIEACRAAWPGSWAQFSDTLDRFIISKPDLLVEAMADFMSMDGGRIEECAQQLRAAIEKRGGKIVWGEG